MYCSLNCRRCKINDVHYLVLGMNKQTDADVYDFETLLCDGVVYVNQKPVVVIV